MGGAVFTIFAGLYYWFPKMSGRMMSEPLGKASFWLMLIGFHVTFLVQHSAGMEGMPRRIYEYSDVQDLAILNLISTIGAFILGVGILLTLINVLVSLKKGAIAGPDPWKANTLEWFTHLSAAGQQLRLGAPHPLRRADEGHPPSGRHADRRRARARARLLPLGRQGVGSPRHGGVTRNHRRAAGDRRPSSSPATCWR